MRAVCILALRALLTCFDLATFDDLVAMTMGTQHRQEYHDALLLKPSAASHTEGERANLQHDSGAVCTSLPPRQGGVRRHPPVVRGGATSRVDARACCVVCSRMVGIVWRRRAAPPQGAQWATVTG